jgi:hypothetical protein
MICKHCNKEFIPKSKHQITCASIECNKERHKETAKIRMKRVCKTEKYKAYHKEWRTKNKEKLKKKWMITNFKKKLIFYGITEQEYNDRLHQQDNKCDICKQPFIDTPYIDHNHTTGKVRGLLCIKCNFILGHSNDDINILNNAICYINKWNTNERT